MEAFEHFKDRDDAGRQLAAVVARACQGPAVVYALVRGGVPLAVRIAEQLRAPLDVVIARKIGHPRNPEYAIGAVTESGDPVIDRSEVARVQGDWLGRAVARERDEARRRRLLYAGGRTAVSCTGKTAIIVDDGVATGYTMEAAIREIQTQRPATTIVAVPVVAQEIAVRLRREADDVVAVLIPECYAGAVSAYYESFPQLTDDDVVRLLRRAPAV